MANISFFVPGLPRPGGSKRAFAHAKTGRIVVMDDCKGNRDWRAVVAYFARQAYTGEPLRVPLRVDMTFFLPRPKGHYRTGKYADQLRPGAPRFPAVKPDLTKLVRAAEDACTGILWHDDALIVWQRVRKEYADEERPGLRLEVTASS